jgi:hypothetical protein
MIEQNTDDLIVFDNLVQANSDIAGDNLPVKARKETGSERKYAQANASGELYRPKDLSDVKARAQEAGKRFNVLFNAETTV